jgi:hypothetical protein
MRKVLALLASAGLAFGATIFAPMAARAEVPATIADYGSTGYANGIHVIGGTSAFNNFRTGAADSSFPLAKVSQDSSPSAHATATYNDSGPIGATEHGCADPSGATCPPVPAVAYANAQYPGGPSDSHIDSCSTGPTGTQNNTPCPPKDANGNQPAPSSADTHAEELKADASANYAGGNAGVPASGTTAESHTIVNPDGTLVVRTHSFIAQMTFGTPPNAIVISKVQVDVTLTILNGQAGGDAKVTIGSVTVNGQAVQVSDQGATFGESTVACNPPPGGLPPPPAVPPLPGSSSSSPPAPTGCTPQVETDNFKLYTVAPVKTFNGNHGTIAASGLHVLVTHPAPPGVPQQNVEYVLGEGYADASANPGSSFSDGGLFGDTGAFNFGGDFGSFDNGAGVAGGAAANAAGSAVHHIGAVLAANRKPLGFLFLFWEALLMGAAAAWVWARHRPVLDQLEVDT